MPHPKLVPLDSHLRHYDVMIIIPGLPTPLLPTYCPVYSYPSATVLRPGGDKHHLQPYSYSWGPLPMGCRHWNWLLLHSFLSDIAHSRNNNCAR
jgi:hypothetical protein